MISVIIPNYNRQEFIIIAVKSALAQEQVKEVIVIDDASTDQSLELLRQLQQEESRVILLENTPNNKGSAHCRNLGIEAATGKYLSFLDSDDILLNNRFGKMLAKLEQNKTLDGVYDNVHSYNKTLTTRISDRDICMPLYVKSIDLFGYLQHNRHNHYLHLSGLLLCRASINDVAFNTKLRISQDTDYIWQLSFQLLLEHAGYEHSMVRRRIHDCNITSDVRRLYPYREILYRSWFMKSLTEDELKSYRWRFFRHYAHWKAVNAFGISAKPWYKVYSYLLVIAEYFVVKRKI